MTSKKNTAKWFFFVAVMAGLLISGCSSFSAKPPVQKPNIIFILADDMGYMDSGLYGSQYYKTPHIDALAERGMMFTNAYSASPLCSPTRASILTGQYPGHVGITMPSCHMPPLPPDQPLLGEKAPPSRRMVTPESRRFLSTDHYTLGEAFADAGYVTGLMGKWHLGRDEAYWPKNHGFQVDMGSPNPGPPSYFAPYRLKNFPAGEKGQYVTDHLTDLALEFLEDHKQKPFMLCLWQFAVHAPFQGPKEFINEWQDVEDPRGVQGCATMAAMLKSMDDGIGKVMAKLEELGIADNTIVIFTSDNGGNMYDEVAGLPPTNNAPLRGGKGNSYEGGSHVPCIVIWPDVVKPGSRCDEVISSVDFYPTMLKMAGIEHNPAQMLDGVSIVPLLKGRSRLKRKAIFCDFPHYVPATQNLPCTWVRQGDWKLMRLYGEGPDRTNGYELYNLKDDISEQHNLASEQPARVRHMDKLIEQHLKETGTLTPITNPAYKPAKTGWKSSQDAHLSLSGETIVLESTGDDPYMSTHDVPLVSHAMRMRFSLRTTIAGEGFFFYADSKTSNFNRDKRIDFDMKADGQWHEYQVDFQPEGELKGLRIDPGKGAGIAEFRDVQLLRKYGESLKTWDWSGVE